MTLLELLLLAVGLSMDAFAVAVCKGLAMKRLRPRDGIIVGAWFGGFQALMPLAGYFLGTAFAGYINRYDHWVAFGLLCLIGGNMIREALTPDKPGEEPDDSLGFRSMLLMAVATSIDALAVGVTFAFVGPTVGIWAGVCIIGAVTFCLSWAGVKIGNLFGAKYEKKAELAGGIILCLLGVKILLEHLGIISF